MVVLSKAAFESPYYAAEHEMCVTSSHNNWRLICFLEANDTYKFSANTHDFVSTLVLRLNNSLFVFLSHIILRSPACAVSSVGVDGYCPTKCKNFVFSSNWCDNLCTPTLSCEHGNGLRCNALLLFFTTRTRCHASCFCSVCVRICSGGSPSGWNGFSCVVRLPPKRSRANVDSHSPRPCEDIHCQVRFPTFVWAVVYLRAPSFLGPCVCELQSHS